MKSMFYVGAALMIGASVYGFVDYQKSKSDKEFTELYSTKQAIDEDGKPDQSKSGEVKTSTLDDTKTSVIDKTGLSEDAKTKLSEVEKISRAKFEERQSSVRDEKVPAKTNKVRKGKHAKRKFTYKTFSRAAPRISIEPIQEKAEKH